MRASYKALRKLTGVDASPEEYAKRLTSLGIEVEAMHVVGGGLDHVVVAEVRGKRAHPKKDSLSLVTIFDGASESEVVCGAPNVPAPGKRVVFAKLGAKLPSGMEIAERKIAGVVSRGMLCSEVELGVGTDGDGILVLGDEDKATVGASFGEALSLEDTVYEIGLTPNRADCLGEVGLARELAVGSGTRLALGVYYAPAAVPEKKGAPSVEVVIEDAKACPRYAAAVVTGLHVGPAPLWLRKRLHDLGLRSINNVVDATNLVMYELGHPIHAFDHSKIGEARVVVRRARAGEKLATLDGQARELVSEDVVIADASKPIALAGVMGGANSEVEASTKTIVIECAVFDPRSVRRTARRLGLHTDASHRFERGVDANAVHAVVERAVALITELSPGALLVSSTEKNEAPVHAREISVRRARVASLLGIPLSPETEARVAALGLDETKDDGATFTVKVPTRRLDLEREIDVIEEIARVHGYDRIPSVVPSVRPSSVGTPRHLRFQRRLRDAAIGAGFDEAINYAFLSEADLVKSRASLEVVRLQNPLSEERSVMRTSMLPGLLSDLGRARRHQSTRVRLFEIGRTFHPAPAAPLPVETPWFALLLSGPRDQWIGEGEGVDFFDAKGAISAILGAAAGLEVTTEVEPDLARAAPHLHPRRAARLLAAGKVIGHLGEVHPDVLRDVDIDARAVFAAVELEALLAASDARPARPMKGVPKVPASTRDLAIVVEEGVPALDVEKALRAAGGSLVEEVRLFDLYRGAPIAAGQKSLAFRLVYRDPSTTLTDDRVDKAHAAVVKAVSDRFQAALRA